MKDVINDAVTTALNEHLATRPASAQAVDTEDLLAFGKKVVCTLLTTIGPLHYQYEIMDGCAVKVTLEKV